MGTSDMPFDTLIDCLAELANASLKLWDVPKNASARLINLSENATYLVEADGGYKSILRVHREGYHTYRAIECELEWMEALGRDGGVVTPPIINGINGTQIQRFKTDRLSDRYLVMFVFLDGEEPNENQDLVEPFHQLGAIAAKTHLHSIGWQRKQPFERLIWDDEMVFGSQANWGNWRDAAGVTAEIQTTLNRCEKRVRDRLATYGKSPDRFGLIHADMRLANLLIDDAQTRLIDFDDCGLGWFMYDFAAGISFMEDHVQVPALKASWVAGYETVRPLEDIDKREIDTFVMLRRMALLAWIGSHANTDLARSLEKDFARVSAELAETYLTKADG
jgi:Ser/Thr protein kinase RdoA (MazF antagonist)